METFSALLAICVGNSPVPGEFPAQRPVMRSFDVLFYLRLNIRLSKQSWGWWFETPSGPLWRRSNVEIDPTRMVHVAPSDLLYFALVSVSFIHYFRCQFPTLGQPLIARAIGKQPWKIWKIESDYLIYFTCVLLHFVPSQISSKNQQHNETKCYIYASVNLVTVASGNVFSTFRSQVITGTTTGLFSMYTHEQISGKFE